LAGVVTVVYGSASGLDGAGRQVWHANVANVPTVASQADFFGSAVATGTLNGDRFADLARAPLSDGALKEVIELGLLECEGDRIRTTDRGVMMLNGVLRRLLADRGSA
jgi:hypothetical protein